MEMETSRDEALARLRRWEALGFVDSRASGPDGACVVMRRNGGRIEIGDSKRAPDDPGAVLSFTPREVRDFFTGVREGDFDALPLQD